MAKKTKQIEWYKKPGMIAASIAMVGALGTAVITLARYIALPQRVEAVEQKTDKIEQYIERQVIQNEILTEILEKQKEEKIIISPNGKRFWDKKLKKWRPIKELK